MSELKIGNIVTDKQERDAIHIAVAPVVATKVLQPGTHVGVMNGRSTPENPVGIVDPFLTQPVKQEQTFWLFLYPNTITSLRHDWTHPAFHDRSITWLKDYASEFDMTYESLLDAATQWLNSGEYHRLGFDTPDRAYTDARKFWMHYQLVTGKQVPAKSAGIHFFSCAC